MGILSAGSSIEMPWQHCLKAILHGYLGGEAGAGAILDILTGKINPSGRLAEAYPLRYEVLLHSGIILLQNVHQSTGKDLL